MSSLTVNLKCGGAQGFTLSCALQLPLQGVTGVFGPSGCGKTTLLHCIAGLRDPAPHSVIHHGEDAWLAGGVSVPTFQRGVGLVFQDDRLFPHLNVSGNLDYAVKRRHSKPPYSRDTVIDWLGIGKLLLHGVSELSGGQRQRVAIARALLNGPNILLLDEPLAGLDYNAKQDCLKRLTLIAKQTKLPMIYVSHDIEELSHVADDLVIMRDGEVTEHGPLIELAGSLESSLARDSNAAAILQASISGHHSQWHLTELSIANQSLWVNALPDSQISQLRLRIAARDVSVTRSRASDSSILNSLAVTLTAMQPCGPGHMLLQLTLGEQFLLARITRKSADQLALQPGDKLFAQIKSTALLSDQGYNE